MIHGIATLHPRNMGHVIMAVGMMEMELRRLQVPESKHNV